MHVPGAAPHGARLITRRHVDLLVPERGVYRTEYTGTTPREQLGLREPLTHRSARPAAG
ncbi:hypothetical protein [Streptomyces sp. NPDC020298]|uniref:hypothetical protein n=1 Tax=unclassified Streptomyces TaxID=2593676 RepID=UPI0033C79F91